MDKFQLQLTSLQNRLDKLQTAHDDHLRESVRKDATLDQLHREIADREVNRNLVVHDRDFLRDAELAGIK